MSRNLSDSKQERDLLNRISRLEQLQRESRTAQIQGADALKLDKTPGLIISWNLAAGQRGWGRFNLQDNNNNLIFGVPSLTFYEGSVGLGNEIGHGYPRDHDYEWNAWNDWGASNGNNLVLMCWIVNNTGSAKTIEAVCDWRYIVSPDSYSSIGG